MSNNPPKATLELDEKEYDFLINNCQVNQQMALVLLGDPNIPKEAAERVVEMLEQFKSLQKKLEEAAAK